MPKPNDSVRRPRQDETLGKVEIDLAQWQCLAADLHWSPRELEVAQLLFAGLKHRAIARRLKIDFATVKTHAAHLHAKTKVRTHAEFVLEIVRRYLVFRELPGRDEPTLPPLYVNF